MIRIFATFITAIVLSMTANAGTVSISSSVCATSSTVDSQGVFSLTGGTEAYMQVEGSTKKAGGSTVIANDDSEAGSWPGGSLTAPTVVSLTKTGSPNNNPAPATTLYCQSNPVDAATQSLRYYRGWVAEYQLKCGTYDPNNN